MLAFAKFLKTRNAAAVAVEGFATQHLLVAAELAVVAAADLQLSEQSSYHFGTVPARGKDFHCWYHRHRQGHMDLRTWGAL